MTVSEYRAALVQELSRSRLNHYDDNYDVMNLGPEPSPSSLENQTPNPRLEQLFDEDPVGYFEEKFGDRLNLGEYLFTCLADQSSRDLLIKVMAYRLVGYRHVKLPRNNPEYWAGIDLVKSLKTETAPLPIDWRGLSLAEYDVTQLGFNMTLYAGDMGLACMLVQRQYEYNSSEVSIKAEIGDIVIDAGACWGETTLYFAHEAGSSGSVYAFEFIPSNLAVTKQNLRNNPSLAANVTIVEHPVWRDSGLTLYYTDDGPGSYVSPDYLKRDAWDGTVSTVTIDGTASTRDLPRIDFIKMDIEGAELAALQGAEDSIRRYRPKLAISLYHAPEDFDSIPRYLSELDLDYDFYLGHHTIYANETVLYGVSKRRP
jgi:FkbM family methyltransferase